MNTIIVDSDEWRMSVVTAYWFSITDRKKPPISHSDMQNPDYLIAGKIGIERATMDDLVQKMKKRSLEGQLERVIEKGYEPAVLIEGIVPSRSEMSLESIYGYLSSLSEGGITVIHTTSPEHTAKHLINLHDKVMKGAMESLRIPTVRSESKDGTVKKLMGIRGVDEITAKKIKCSYPNALSFTWDCYRQLKGLETVLMKIEGIGKKKADTIAEDWVMKWQ